MKLLGNKERLRELPVLPTQHALIFPGHVSTLFVTTPEGRAVVETAAKEGRRNFLAVPQRALRPDPGPDDLYSIGTLVWILHIIPVQEGTLRLIVDGRGRAEIKKFIERKNIVYGEYRQIPDNKRDPDNELSKLSRLIRESFDEYVKLTPHIKSDAQKHVRKAEDPIALINAVATCVSLDLETKIAIFSEPSILGRARLVLDGLDGDVELLGLKRSIKDRVRKRMEQQQKDHFLNEQIREMNRELGKEDEEDGTDDLVRRVGEANLPDDVRTQAEKEIRRLKKLPPVAPEAGIIRTYIDWLLDLPWEPTEHDAPNISDARRILDEDHYDMERPKERILEYVAVQVLNPRLKAPILCFVGPPGTGKTSLGKSMARALGRSFARLSLGGVRDEAEIRGHRRTYVGAMPGRIIQAMKRADSHDPVILLDEVDKLGTDFRGDPASALLEVLDPEQNNTFSDHYIELPFDLSRVVFLTTANSLHSIPAALRDRLEIIEIPGYTEREKERIAKDFLIPEQLAENGLKNADIAFRRDGILTLIRDYTTESGVRSLKRETANVIRKLARELMETEIPVTEYARTVGGPTVSKLLGPPRYRHDTSDHAIDVPGVVNGLAWTENGGVLLAVEVAVLPGSGSMQLTGSLGDVMKESAHAARSYILAHAETFGVDYDRGTHSIHIHVPQGAIPKDGPSAGITMFTALLSALTGRIARDDTAMTGEITLSGRVLPIGGLKEKILAARRCGIPRVIIPAGNAHDLEALPNDVKNGIDFLLVRSVSDLLNEVLR